MDFFAQMQFGGKKKDIFQCIIQILCFIASGKTRQLAREFEAWDSTTGKEKIPAG